MKNVDSSLLKRLSDEFAVTSGEQPTVALIESLLNEKGVSYTKDMHGNILVGNIVNPKYGFAAHLDEVGIMVTGITEDGLVKFISAGYIHPVTLLNTFIEVQTENGAVLGSVFSGRMFAGGLSNYELQHSDLVLDIGAKSKSEAEALGIKVGSLGTYKKHYSETEDSISATGIDNTVGLYLLLELLFNAPDLENCVYLFHRGEESGSFGAQTFQNNCSPEYMFVVDYFPAKIEKTHNSDIYPDVLNGPAVVYAARGYIIDTKIKAYLEMVAKDAGIEIQKCFMPSKGAAEVPHFQTNGTIGANVCVPARGFHSQNYVVFKKDILSTYQYIEALSMSFSSKERVAVGKKTTEATK